MDLYIIPQIKEIVGFYSRPHNKLLNQNKKTKKEKEENAGLIAF